MKTKISMLLMGVMVALMPQWAGATSITPADFIYSTDNAVFMEFCVLDNGSPNSTAADLATVDILLAITVNSTFDTIYFEFVNGSTGGANVAEIYFDDDEQGFFDNGSVAATDGTVSFAVGGVSPPNLPGGNSLANKFTATRPLSAGLTGNTATGLQTGENLVLAYDILDLTDFQDALTDGTFRIGMHVRSIGTGGQSDGFIGKLFEFPEDPTPNTPVPEPTTLVLLGMGSVFLAARKRFS